MKKLNHAILLFLLAAGIAACDKPAEQGEAPKADEPAAKTAGAPATAAQAEPEAPAAKVEVSAEGQKFDPAIKPEQLPDGAWYCDMGTVHWAAMNNPADGKCPECGMALKQYASADHAAQKEKAVEAKPDDHGHEHGEGEHDHAH